MGTDAIFMDDKARPHRERLVRSYLESETIPQMAWPARSPDFNPSEHVWDILGRRIAGQSVPPGTLHELQQALLQEWALLPKQAINYIIASMSLRCQAFQIKGAIPIISMWFPLHILPTNLGCRAVYMCFCWYLLYCLIRGLVMPQLPRVQLSRISIK
ncbi:hypothetical protein AVEN_217994-1 [Araneus ventricosus]|uniref:Tc1-like transposase DDE domain-containing protein n=1 Tax=Araneus ventricosus TaxID=182803 RepID=A0A4Y2DXG1_ARAVE|nr:hypothetical protein AVEN_217994-1 [Araneus ventricosus]